MTQSITKIQSYSLQSSSYFNEGELETVVNDLNKKYMDIEETDPSEGYQVEITTHPKLQGKLIRMGDRRTQPNLIGLPADDTIYKTEDCPFCPGKTARTPLKIFKEFEQSYAIFTNRSQPKDRQILVIPKEHYPHFFKTPKSIQLDLLKAALSIRQEYPEAEAHNIGLHCGSKGLQTVFHTHVRTAVYPHAQTHVPKEKQEPSIRTNIVGMLQSILSHLPFYRV